MQKADVWPLNPNGELLLGVKIEDKFGFANLEEIVRVPGIAFGEGGPGDMGLSFGFKPGDPKAKEVQDKIFAAAKAKHLYWLGIGTGATEANREAAVAQSIKEGHMVGSGEQTAAMGRKMTKRPQPY
jgi:4-hydroxy-2-oxoheptanedioate aldolase